MSYLRFLMSQPLENRDRIASTTPKKVEVSKPILKKEKQEVGPIRTDK
jgi:hypothetical protein